MTGELEGLSVGEQSTIQYNGVSQKDMMKEFKGETGYNQEVSNWDTSDHPHQLRLLLTYHLNRLISIFRI
jgi:hypothetical protein